MGPCAVARASLFATPSLRGVARLRGAGHGGDASGCEVCSSLSTQRRCQLSNDKSNDKNPEGRLDVRADQPAPFAAHSHAHSLKGGAAAERGVLVAFWVLARGTVAYAQCEIGVRRAVTVLCMAILERTAVCLSCVLAAQADHSALWRLSDRMNVSQRTAALYSDR